MMGLMMINPLRPNQPTHESALAHSIPLDYRPFGHIAEIVAVARIGCQVDSFVHVPAELTSGA